MGILLMVHRKELGCICFHWKQINVRRRRIGGGNSTQCFALCYRRKPTPLRDAVFLLWTLPRAKNCSPALNFYTSVRTGAALSSPFFNIILKGLSQMG